MRPSTRSNALYFNEHRYQQSIGPSQLRLIEAVCISREALEFRLIHVPRATAPPYTAVSYRWGDDEPSEIIKLDNQIFHVRPNLWSCLYYLGLESRSNHAGWRYLWVDAICINQRNSDERNAQVLHMDQTYRDAICVSVWLGLIPIPEEYRPLLSYDPPLTIEADLDWYESIQDLANRTYWSRYWVIQEFLLGKNVQLHCSNTSMDWMDFQELLCRKVGIPQFSNARTAVLPNDTAVSLAALPLTLGRHPDRYPEFLQPLGTLLVTHSRSKCKDPRDRIFALLGLVSSDERQLLGRFFPDYTIDINVVWIVTLAHLIQYESLENPKLRNITVDSEDIFRGLGVGPKSHRRSLIDQANKMDYLGDWEPGHLSQWLEDGTLDFQIGGNDNEVTSGMAMGETRIEGLRAAERDMWKIMTWHRETEDVCAQDIQAEQTDWGATGRAKVFLRFLLLVVLLTVGAVFGILFAVVKLNADF